MIQYPKHEHLTLGGVENWGHNTNILRDPPKAIFTRRIDKVGQNTDITELVDSSSDRAADSIQVYARGVNPMVSVSYSNYGNNGGMSGNPTSTSGRTQAFLPYPAMEGGAFRPPVRNPRDLLPLSRLPRTTFSVDAMLSAVDYSKTKQQPNDYRAVKKDEDVVHAFDIRPNQSANISVKSLENFVSDPKASINERHINVDASSGFHARDISSYTREHVDKSKGILEKILKAFAQSTKTSHISHNLDNLTIDQKRYIQNVLHTSGHTNLSKQVAQGLENLSIDEKRYIQEVLHTSGHTNPSKQVAQGLDNLSIDEKRYIQDVLHTSGHTNLSKQVAQGLDNLSIDEKRYIQEVLHAHAFANRSANINAKQLHELDDTKGRISVKDDMLQYNLEAGMNPGYTFLGEMATPVLDGLNLPQHSKYTQLSDSRVHRNIQHENTLQLERTMPVTSATAAITKIEDLNSLNLSSREARLAPTLNVGGFGNVGHKPSMDRANLISVKESEKDRLRQAVNQQQFNRFDY